MMMTLATQVFCVPPCVPIRVLRHRARRWLALQGTAGPRVGQHRAGVGLGKVRPSVERDAVQGRAPGTVSAMQCDVQCTLLCTVGPRMSGQAMADVGKHRTAPGGSGGSLHMNSNDRVPSPLLPSPSSVTPD